MPVRKVYGTLSSLPTLRILVSLYEHDLDFDFVLVDVETGEHKNGSFLSLNPFGEIPAFQDGDLTLFESRAVMRYISFEYPQPGEDHTYRGTPLIHGIVSEWIEVEDHQFDPPTSKLIEELIFKPKNGLDSNHDIVAKEEATLAKVLDVYEERLAASRYLAGEKFTSADLTHLPNLHFLMKTPVRRLLESRPNVAEWCSKVLARPAWVKVVDDREELMSMNKCSSKSTYDVHLNNAESIS